MDANFYSLVRDMSLETTDTDANISPLGPPMTKNPYAAIPPSSSIRGAVRGTGFAAFGQTEKVQQPAVSTAVAPLSAVDTSCNIKEEEVLTKDEGTYECHPGAPIPIHFQGLDEIMARHHAADYVERPSLSANEQVAVQAFGIREGQPFCKLEEATPVASLLQGRLSASQPKVEPEEDRDRDGIDMDLEHALEAVLIRDPKSTLQLTGNQERRLELLHKVTPRPPTHTRRAPLAVPMSMLHSPAVFGVQPRMHSALRLFVSKQRRVAATVKRQMISLASANPDRMS